MNFTTYCPGIYTSVKQASANSPAMAVCIAAPANSLNKDTLCIYNKEGAVAAFSAPTEECPLTALICAALENGATRVYAINCTENEDYINALKSFEGLNDAFAVVFATKDTDILSNLREFIELSEQNIQEKYAVMAVDSENIEAFDGLRHKRAVFVSQPGTYEEITSVYVTASAVAGMISRCVTYGDILNSKEFYNVCSDMSITASTADSLILMGISPIGLYGKNSLVRCISSDNTKVSDIQLSICSDRLIMGARKVLNNLFDSALPVTYSAIETSLIVYLENAVDKNIITSYKKPLLKQNKEDSSVCEISLSFVSAQGINQICIIAQAEN